MYFINGSSVLLKYAQMLRRFSKKIQVKPTQLLTSRIQVQTKPFTNASFTILASDLLSLIACSRKFNIVNSFLTYEFSYSVVNTKININKKHEIHYEGFPVFPAEDPDLSFQVPSSFFSKIRLLTDKILDIELKEERLRVEANDDVHLCVTFSGISHISGKDEARFRVRNSDIGFLHFFDEESLVISVLETYVVFTIFSPEFTTLARVPMLQ